MAFDINKFLTPTKYKWFRKELSGKKFRLLDVGCTNKSSLLAKFWFPECEYHGVDLTDAHITQDEKAMIDRFYQANLETSDLSEIPDGAYDVIIVAHVIEHLTNSLEVLGRLTRKLAKGGRIYIEFPSVRSLALPSAKVTLNFCDDPTHVRVYDLRDVANVLLANELKIIRGGRRREWVRIFIFPITIPLQITNLLKEGRLHGLGMWDLMGFADFVYARKSEA